jgi:PAS domain S-box-containing protein
MEKGTKSEAKTRRQVAEELLKNNSSKITVIPSEAETLKLIHELQVQQIELELQNEELMLAKAAEYESALKYIELYDSAPSGYLTISKEGKIEELNLTGVKMLGKERQALKNNKFELFISDDTRDIFNEFLGNVFTTRNKESCEVKLISTVNQPLYVYLTGIVTKNGKQCLVTMVDVTDRKLAREELKIKMSELIKANNELTITEKALKENESRLVQLNVDKDRFISILGHDLRSPFSGLLGLSELLRGNIRKFDIDEIEVFANYINSSAQITYNLLENLLIWGRSQSGRIPFNPQNINLNDVCKEVLQLFNSSISAKNITVSSSFSSDILVYADVEMFKTIIRNIVSNAIKFSNKNGSINIFTEQTKSDITISVMDNGVGIKPENLPKLFDISQIHTTVGTAEEEGTGLGLLICKEFVEKHNGTIGVESLAGEGSRFHFTLPFKPEQKETKSATSEQTDGQFKNLKILIADDDKASRLILALTLKSCSKEIVYAKTGLEAVTEFEKNPDVDLILMDIKMPEIDGFEATRRIRLVNKEVVIIVQTAFSLTYEKENAFEAGCNDFISKPIDKTTLFDLIRKHFNKQGQV